MYVRRNRCTLLVIVTAFLTTALPLTKYRTPMFEIRLSIPLTEEYGEAVLTTNA